MGDRCETLLTYGWHEIFLQCHVKPSVSIWKRLKFFSQLCMMTDIMVTSSHIWIFLGTNRNIEPINRSHIVPLTPIPAASVIPRANSSDPDRTPSWIRQSYGEGEWGMIAWSSGERDTHKLFYGSNTWMLRQNWIQDDWQCPNTATTTTATATWSYIYIYIHMYIRVHIYIYIRIYNVYVLHIYTVAAGQ